jgi:DNA polymerase-3 subunit alpha
VKPRSIEEISALVSLIRPGTLNAYFEGKSMAQHYVDRKSGKDEVKYLHPALEPILKDTYGVLVYQEQSMLIAREIAGFTEQEADNLRKAMGKKLADLMAKLKVTFLDGCKNKGIVSEAEAAQIFDWIEASNRYSFNKSHGVSYGMTAYMSAICKARNILKFYEVYLDHARRKQDTQEEIKALIYDARVNNIDVYPPRLGTSLCRFYYGWVIDSLWHIPS